MTVLEIWLLAIGLAMDCFTVSIASGIILKRIHWRVQWLMPLSFGIFQALMPVIGWFCASRFSVFIEDFDHWVAFALLAFLGGRMIWGYFSEKEDEDASFNPLKLKVILTMAVATSIDALAVGISFACLGMNTLGSLLYPVGVIGLVSFLFAWGGLFIGIFVGKRFNWPVEPIGGLILIIIGIKVLLEHLSIL